MKTPSLHDTAEQGKNSRTFNCTQMTWSEMAETVRSIWMEMKRRNPIGINMYAPAVKQAADLLHEIAQGEAGNFTSEAGPKEPKSSSARR